MTTYYYTRHWEKDGITEVDATPVDGHPQLVKWNIYRGTLWFEQRSVVGRDVFHTKSDAIKRVKQMRTNEIRKARHRLKKLKEMKVSDLKGCDNENQAMVPELEDGQGAGGEDIPVGETSKGYASP